MRQLAFLVSAVLVGGVLAGCSSGDGKALPPPPVKPLPSTTTTEPLDYSQVSLPVVAPGKKTPVTKPRTPGEAALFGRVIDNNGQPVPQALVRATYYLDPAAPEVIESLTGDDGSYRFDQLYGGSWRIRAWKEPYLATLEAPALFLSAKEQKALDLKVKEVPEVAVTSKIAPDPPLLGYPAELAVLVVNQTVDAEGVVRRSGVGGAEVALYVTGKWSLVSGSNPKSANDDGTVRWTLICGAEGNQGASAVVYGQEFPLTLPACLDPASTTTATTAPPASGPSSSTSTTRKKASYPSATTTSTSTSTSKSGQKPTSTTLPRNRPQ